MFYKGLKDGEWIYWRKDGTIFMTEEWNKGKLSGKQLLYDEQGNISETIEYKRKSQARKTADSLIVSNGKKKTIYTFDRKGNIQTKAQLKDGEKEGKQRHYEEGKLVKTEVYRKGRLAEDGKEAVSGEKEKKSWFPKKEKDPEAQEKKQKAKKKWFGKKPDDPGKRKSGKKKDSKHKKGAGKAKKKKKDKKRVFDFLRKKKTSR